MKLEKSNTHDRAVSPVLGVALLVAMTVILAGVIGFVVLGVDSGSADEPQASLKFHFNATSSDVTMIHEGGDRLNGEELTVTVDGADQGDLSGEGTITAGDEVVVYDSASEDDMVKIIWDDPNSDRDVVIAEDRMG